MVEGDGLARFLAAQHILGQQLVLVKQLGQVLLGQGLGGIGRGHHRLHGQLRESQIVRHVEQIVGEIHVVVGEGAPHIIALAAAGSHQLLELGHDAVIAAVARQVHPEPVVHFLAAVQRKHHIVAFLVGPLDDFIGDADAVGGQGKPEILAGGFLDAAGVGHQLLAHLKVHQRFAAEKVHFQVAAGTGIFHQEIQRPLAGLKAHQARFAVELALGRKAVAAVQVAGMGHVQAKGLDHIGPVLEIKGMVGVGVGGKQLALGGQLVNVVQAVPDIGGGHVGAAGILFLQRGGGFFPGVPGVDQSDGVIGHIVHRVHAAAEHVQHDVVTAQFVLMDHGLTPC